MSKATIVGLSAGVAFVVSLAVLAAVPTAYNPSGVVDTSIFQPDYTGAELNDRVFGDNTAIYVPDSTGAELNDRVYE